MQAYTLICKMLDRDRDGGDLNLNLLVPASQCGSIFGNIKEIRETTGASIHVLPGRNLLNSRNVIITLGKPSPSALNH